ncbi:MAG: hypothetical protein RIS14_105, partial [Pseudomonadota bacterium]
GRRRRRQEGEIAGAVEAANDQSEMDFEDADDVLFDAASSESETYDEPTIPDTETDSRKQPPAIQRTAPVVVSSIPVSTAESDFSDLETATEAHVVDPIQALAESDSTSTAEPFTAKIMAIPEVVTVEDTVPEPVAQPVQSAQTEFIEPKPKQTGYVPVAPPSFSMPNTPNTGFDFTVRISPESKED